MNGRKENLRVLLMGWFLLAQVGCSTAETPRTEEADALPEPVVVRAALARSTELCEFAVYSQQQTALRDRVTCHSGFIGSAGGAEAGVNALIEGDIEAKGNVLLRNYARVNGNATAGLQMQKQPGAYVAGETAQYASVPLYPIPTKTVTPGTANFQVYSGQSRTAAPGSYNEIHVYGGGTLMLTAGVYNTRQFIIEASNVHLRLNISEGPIEVNVKEMLRFGDHTTMELIGGDDPRKVTFYTNYPWQIPVGTDSTVVGNLVAPYGEVTAFSRTTIHGNLQGRQVIIDTDSHITGAGCVDPCEGVTCDTPPEDVCLDANTLRIHDPVGACDEGECDYGYEDVSCPYGCEEGACNVSQCDTGACCDSGFFRPEGYECRPSAGPCDEVETCSGDAAECPPDGFAPEATECRAAAGMCDVAESCTGTSAECPADGFVPETTECRASAGVCDLAESCTGISAECPADLVAVSGMECRASAGVCDVAEACDGVNDECPVDGFAPETTECRASAGLCDLAESCTGASAECPSDAVASSGTECRAVVGVCDVAETCDGIAVECPADGKSTAECRAAAGVCDVAEMCDGVSDDCPVDGFLPETTECRSAAGLCDLAETCTGSSVVCPVDVFASAGTECRSVAGVCDVAESCSGDSAACPLDDFELLSVRCGVVPEAVEERCADTACGSDLLAREAFAYCSGTAAACGVDNVVWHEWEVTDTCDGDSLCVSVGDEASCEPCAYGCEGGACIDPCAGVVCDNPPADACLDGDTLAVYLTTGTCEGGECSYGYEEQVCEHGCSDGACRACSVGECCTEDGFIKSSEERCGAEAVVEELACSDGECGGSVSRRQQMQYCNGVSAACGMDNLRWEAWKVIQTCYSYGHCVADGNGAWCENCENGCAEGACNDALPPDPSTVAPPLDPTRVMRLKESTAFLYTGENAVQKGLDPEIIDEKRTVVLRGLVMARDETPLSGVTVTILDHPEYGATVTREDGWFDMVANGGGLWTLKYEKPGFLPVQRQIRTPWEDYRQLPDVVMIPADTVVNTLDFSDGAVETQIVFGAVSSDERGDRQPTLIVPPGIQAEMVMRDGSRHPVEELDLRMTEYTVGDKGPETMPAELPPSTAYTYAVELGSDVAYEANAKSIELTEPVYLHLDNFLDFPAGAIIPAGYYDRDKAAWLPEQNGVVVEVLDLVDGKAVLDAYGTGEPLTEEILEWMGVTDEELQHIAATRSVGETFWRVPFNHFSPHDLNVPTPYWVRENDSSPDDRPYTDYLDAEESCEQQGSTMYCFDSAVGETVPVPGTSMSLAYRSDLVAGNRFKRRLRIPVPTADFCAEEPVVGTPIDVEVDVGGRKYRYEPCCETDTCTEPEFRCSAQFSSEALCPGEPGEKGELIFNWDGVDAYGRPVVWAQRARVTISRTAQSCIWQLPSVSIDRNPGEGWVFGGYCTNARCTLYDAGMYPREWCQSNTRSAVSTDVSIGAIDRNAVGLGGWTLDAHHLYDVQNDVLYKGTGERRKAEKMVSTLEDLPLNVPTWPGLGYWSPRQIAGAADGSIYHMGVWLRQNTPGPSVLSPYGFYRFDPETGQSTEVLPNIVDQEAWDYCSPGSFTHMRIGPKGDLYFTSRVVPMDDWGIWKMDPAGNVTHVGGCGESAWETMPATQARLHYIQAIAIDSKDRVYLAEWDTDRIRMINNDGIIETIAYSPSGDPATIACSNCMVIGSDDSLYILQREHWEYSYIWRLLPSGQWERFLGGSWDHYGVLPTDGASISTAPASELGIDREDSLFYTQWIFASDRKEVRQVSDGYVRNIAGTGALSHERFLRPVPALQAPVHPFLRVAATPDGNMYFLSDWNWTEFITRLTPVPTQQGYGTIVVPSDDASELYEFDESGRHLATRDGYTGADKHQFGYDDHGYLISVTDAAGNVTAVARDVDGKATGIVAPDYGSGLAASERTTVLGLDTDDNLSRIVLPDNATYQMESTPDGLLTRFTDPNDNDTQFTYDPDGRLVTDLDDAGSLKTLTSEKPGYRSYRNEFTSGENVTFRYGQSYNPVMKEWTTAVTLPSGLLNTARKDDAGVYTVETADGMTTTTVEDSDPRFGMRSPVIKERRTTTPGGLEQVVSTDRTVSPSTAVAPENIDTLTESATVNGKSFVRTYDADLHQWTYTSAAGRRSYAEVDDIGRVIRAWAATLEEVRVDYDDYGRIEAVHSGVEPDERTYRFTYDERGYLESVTDPQERVTSYINDEVGQVVSKILPDGREIGFTYDPNGNVTGITPPGRPAHGFDYTAVNLLSDYDPPLLSGEPQVSTHYTYNLDRQIDLITRPDGQTIDYVYDDAGRLSQMDLAGLEEILVTYNAGTGKIQSVSSPDSEQLSYTFDGALLTGTALGGTISGAVSQQYNNDFQVVARDVNGAHGVSFAYDNDGLLRTAGSETLQRNTATGFLDGTTLGQVTSANTYSTFGELASESYLVSGAPIYEVSYTRDTLGRIATKTETIDGETVEERYDYDVAGRLTDVYLNAEVDPIAHYDYDDNGNRVSHSDYRSGVAVVQNGAYDDQDRMVSYGNAADGYADYTYSANGELETRSLNGENTIYDYDVLGNLRSVTLPDGTEIRYLVDGLGRRVGKQVNGVVEQGLLYKDALNPIAELDENGNVVSRFVYGSKLNVPDYFESNKADGSTWVTYRMVSNHLGSPRLVVNAATGEVVQRMDYDEFGRVLEDTNPGFQPFGFAGGLYDTDTGLVRFGARDYDAESGRWTTKDPIGFGGGDTNLYGYVMTDPVNGLDPRGLWTIGIGLSGNAGVALGGGGGALIVFDGQGNIGIVAGAGPGAINTAAASGGVQIQVTDADKIFDLEGFCAQIGGSIDFGFSLGAEVIIEVEGKYGGVNLNIGVGVSATLAEFHEIIEGAGVWPLN